jgi:nicotinate phosphoribosyltransferase
MGTAAHAFTLLHETEEEAFRAQIAAFGPETTLLVDTYDVEEGIETAVRVAGPELGAVRLDSGDLPTLVLEVRKQLDSLGATNTKITVTNDLDEHAIAALAAVPVDSYGVGTSVVTGSGSPAAGMVYKLVARKDSEGAWVSVAKTSQGKVGVGGRKYPVRRLNDARVAIEEVVYVGDGPEASVSKSEQERPLLVQLVDGGEIDPQYTGPAGTAKAREHRARVLTELPADASRLGRGDPTLPTRFVS